MLDRLPDELLLRIFAEVPLGPPVDGFVFRRPHARAELLWRNIYVDDERRVDRDLRSLARELVVVDKGVDHLEALLRALPEVRVLRINTVTGHLLPRTYLVSRDEYVHFASRLTSFNLLTRLICVDLRSLALREVLLDRDDLQAVPSLEALSLTDLVFDKHAEQAVLSPDILPNLRIFHFADILSGYTAGSSSYFPPLSPAFSAQLRALYAPSNTLGSVAYTRMCRTEGSAAVVVHLPPEFHQVKLGRYLPAHLELYDIPAPPPAERDLSRSWPDLSYQMQWSVKMLERLHSALDNAVEKTDRLRGLESLALPLALHPRGRHYHHMVKARDELLWLFAQSGVAVRWVEDAAAEGDERPGMEGGFGEWWERVEGAQGPFRGSARAVEAEWEV
ncbi:hypothetical protein JCM10450v2_003383 [Rhodotorula kratochvilovae]